MECFNPFQLKNTGGTGINYLVPCGKCPTCVKRRVSQWSFRLMEQGKNCISSHFITLTYDTEHIPITKKKFASLRKTHLQDFFKRLRRYSELAGERERIKYYAVGEYGTRSRRPHYHIILFNGRPEHITHAWSLEGKAIGGVHFGEVSGASIGYTLKYINKKAVNIGRAEWDDREPEFALMSKGLGADYLTPKIVSWHHLDKLNRMYVNLLDGKKVGMPVYYKNKIYEKNERKLIGEYVRAQKMLESYRKNPKSKKAVDDIVSAAYDRLKINIKRNESL